MIVTEVAPVKLVPVITMEAPELRQAVIGLKLNMDCEKLSIPDNNEIKISKKKDFEFTVLENEFISKLKYFFFIIVTLFNQTVSGFANCKGCIHALFQNINYLFCSVFLQ